MGEINYFLILAIAIPFLFVIGIVYSALKDQNKLEHSTLKEVLKQREIRKQLPKDHPDYLYVKPYDEDEDEGNAKANRQSTKPSSPNNNIGTTGDIMAHKVISPLNSSGVIKDHKSTKVHAASYFASKK